MIDARTLIHIETDANHPDGAGIPICSLPKKAVANAQLIYAAPDMLVALEADAALNFHSCPDCRCGDPCDWYAAKSKKVGMLKANALAKALGITVRAK